MWRGGEVKTFGELKIRDILQHPKHSTRAIMFVSQSRKYWELLKTKFDMKVIEI